ncbi:Uncharacterized protein OS=Pirellula staleyi (strain ATCC 27377 / DSM 6068 / ICPB 4128) GN=Psta_2561 PE=4 SV=1 [Gemmataceae bacterium]|nr:Uncharacterized protein OS=Pirellula staleyi (strain ATCC 27377 / DSM 6068 / ICPB 4128) GN=Psta_2561 PE=4 SV=1 [Gemmataceae bacterium]VTT96881.1 Uncharacterized protein OS=Pirellula staleyi (strain ATCC 27377 / DSM 6068 / ICPB 4128) GN=Psta_2561 PE=4 SV=1 [Gemmataceae bacterium]
MPATHTRGRIGLVLTCLWLLGGAAAGQDAAVTLQEKFDPGHTSKVDVAVKLTGRLAVPLQKGKAPDLVTLAGTSRVTYEERVLPPDDAGTLKSVRGYREVEFGRTLGNATQDAGIRPSVRRMVVIKTENRRAPFSPDGPLTWGEIDVVRTDVFNPAVVPGLLPGRPVKKGDTWKVTPAAVAELTDMEKIEAGELTVEFVGTTEIGNQKMARLQISGTVRGVNQDGPSRQKLDGTAYFDLGAGTLAYLSLKGTHELLDGAGQVVGRIEGQFTMTRTKLDKLPPDLSDASLRGLELRPNAENTLMLYDDPRLGVRFLYPRGWRVGAVQGKQVTLDHARGSGVLITVEPTAKVPTAAEYAKEIATFIQKEKATVTAEDKPTRVRAEPVQLDRFGMDATFGNDKVRLEYAVLAQSDGGVTLAARIPAADAAALKPEVERVIRSLSVTKKIEEPAGK